MSDKITISVLRWNDGWRLLKDSRKLAAYDYKVDAEEAAFDLARRAHRSGRDVELLVQDDKTSEISAVSGWATLH